MTSTLTEMAAVTRGRQTIPPKRGLSEGLGSWFSGAPGIVFWGARGTAEGDWGRDMASIMKHLLALGTRGYTRPAQQNRSCSLD